MYDAKISLNAGESITIYDEIHAVRVWLKDDGVLLVSVGSEGEDKAEIKFKDGHKL